MIFLDTETIGLDGPIVLIQYAYDNGPVHKHYIWEEQVKTTLDLLTEFTNHPEGVCAFNLAFDWYKVQQLYNYLLQLNLESIPDPFYKFTNYSFYCLKPQNALDLMLTGKKGEFQITMERRPFKIRKIPLAAIDILRQLLNKPYMEWKQRSSDLEMRPALGGKLKDIVSYLGLPNVDKTAAAKAPYDPELEWFKQVKIQTNYWKNNATAAKYATADIEYLQFLYKYYNSPRAGSNDDLLTICVACCRHIGYSINMKRLITKRTTLRIEQDKLKFNPNAPQDCLRYLHEVCDDLGKATILNTNKTTLKKIPPYHSAYKRAQQILSIRKKIKQINTCDKLIAEGGFYPDFKVIGAKSGRMSGGSGKKKGSINPQGIPKALRDCFTLTRPQLPILCNGDFASFEPTILAAVVNSQHLNDELKSGKKIYDVVGDIIAPQASYEKRKSAFLGYNYGAQPSKLAEVYEITEEEARKGLEELIKRHPEIEQARKKLTERFCSMSQPNGIGTEVIWKDPDDCIETMFGFRRFFTLENQVTKQLFETARTFRTGLPGTVVRSKHKGPQTVDGAVRSALYAAAFAIQARNMRAAFNHRIQGTGAEICKDLQVRLWKLQPKGIHRWVIAPFNVHDEVVATVCDEETAQQTKEIANVIIKKYRPHIPLIRLEWKTNLDSWEK